MFAFAYIKSEEEKTDICRRALTSLKMERGAGATIDTNELVEFTSHVATLMVSNMLILC